MLSWIREKMGTAVIGGIIAFIAFVFVFYGVFSPKATRGLHEGSVAGTVNGESISIGEFNREVSRRLEFYKSISGGKITEEQMKAFRIREGVFQELANRKLMIQEAKRQGLVASDEEIRDKIMAIPAFQKEGKFDLPTYKQILEANNHTVSSFERLVRDDASAQHWEGYFQDRVHVSDDELKKEFILSQEKRNLKYVLLTAESARKNIKVSDDEVKKFLAESANLNLARAKFDSGASSLFKGQKFEEVKDSIARTILASQQSEQIQKLNEELADRVLPILTADPGSDARVNALLKATLKDAGVQVKMTGWVTRESNPISGIGDAQAFLKDAFGSAEKKAKKYHLAGRILVGVVAESQSARLADLPAQRETLVQKMLSRKARDLSEEWMKLLTSRAKIESNPSVIGAAFEAGDR